MHIVFFQYGDFADAYRRFQAGGLETYRDQRASVDFVASLRSRNKVTTIAVCDRDHTEQLHENLFSIGIGNEFARDRRALFRILSDARPDVFVCRTPNYHAIKWARRHVVPTLLSFADIFSNDSPKQLFRNISLRTLLDPCVFPCVANHSVNASISVSNALFYPKSRVVPWDWSRLRVESASKQAPGGADHPSAFFGGALTIEKGVGDCLEAVSLLQKRGINLYFEFAGAGDMEMWRARASQLGVGDQVRFLGLISNADVRQRMSKSDIVVVPSRHDYAEGMPNTIYEALASRTPLVISDHPAFAGRLRNGEDCLVFCAADPSSLADQVTVLLKDAGLFSRLSKRSAIAHDSLYVGMNWMDLVSTFLNDPRNQTGWVAANSLARLAGVGGATYIGPSTNL